MSFEDHIRRVEAMLAEMTEHPDRVFHEAYLAYALHGCAELADLTEEQRGALLRGVETACVGILCPPLAVGAAGNEVYLLVQMNPDRSADDIARTAGAALGSLSPGTPRWSGDYSAVSLGTEEAEDMAPAISRGDESARALFRQEDWEDEE